MNEFIDMCLSAGVAIIAFVVLGALAYGIVEYGPRIIKSIVLTIKWNIDKHNWYD